MKNLPQKLYLASQVRDMDRIAIEEYGIKGIALMRKAGLVVFELIKKNHQNKAVVVFCGAGNNAGDGYVIARLALESACKVNVIYTSDPEKLKGDALIAYKDYKQAGGKVKKYKSNIKINSEAVIVDALLGTGLNREVSGEYAEAIAAINVSSCHVISVDIPSGLNADTGNRLGCTVKANNTVSFIGLKQGLFTGYAAEHCGKIYFSALGLTSDMFQNFEHASTLLTHCRLPKRNRCAHKGNNGHVLLIGGDTGFSGAIKLAAEAALRVGSGLVSIATRKIHSGYINMARPEIMSHGVECVDELIPLINKATVVVIGPGLGQGVWGQEMFNQAIKSDKPMVIDADALNLLAKTNLNCENWVLTPHPGEAARLLSVTTADIAKDRFNAISKLQNKFSAVVVLKGAGTLIYNGTDITVSTTGNPGMASGGMGDVLSGMIAGLIAQKMSLDTATIAAVHLHGKAADLSAQQDGERGLLASDLMPFIRKLVNE